MEQSIKDQLFNLTPKKFEEFCADLLNAENQFDKFFITVGTNDDGVDILALKGIKKIAIQVKHRYRIKKDELHLEIERCKGLLEFHHEFIYITSAKLSKEIIDEFETEKVRIISQHEILELLDKHEGVAQRYFSLVQKRNTHNKRWLSASFVGVIMSIASLLINFFIEKKVEQKTLEHRIGNVESALEGIKGLEKDLESIKKDMIQTDLESKKILEEYKRMQGLKKLTKEQKESLNAVLNYQPWYKKVLSYFLAIITGIFTSIIASIFYERWKLRRQLSK